MDEAFGGGRPALHGDFYQDPDDVIRGLSLSVEDPWASTAPMHGDFYTESDDVTRGLSWTFHSDVTQTKEDDAFLLEEIQARTEEWWQHTAKYALLALHRAGIDEHVPASYLREFLVPARRSQLPSRVASYLREFLLPCPMNLGAYETQYMDAWGRMEEYPLPCSVRRQILDELQMRHRQRLHDGSASPWSLQVFHEYQMRTGSSFYRPPDWADLRGGFGRVTLPSNSSDCGSGFGDELAFTERMQALMPFETRSRCHREQKTCRALNRAHLARQHMMPVGQTRRRGGALFQPPARGTAKATGQRRH